MNFTARPIRPTSPSQTVPWKRDILIRAAVHSRRVGERGDRAEGRGGVLS